MKQSGVRPMFVEFIPEQLDEGVLYISERYKTASHKCCCGCGEEVVTPLSAVDWSLRVDGEVVSMHPSIGNWKFGCRSHYWIRRNQIIWAGSMNEADIARAQRRDLIDKERHIAAINRAKESPAEPKRDQVAPTGLPSPNFLERAWLALTRWLR